MTDSNTPTKNAQVSKATTQSRRLISTWQSFNKIGWNSDNLKQLSLINQRLIGYAERYQDEDHLTVAQAIDTVLSQLITSNQTSELETLTQRVRDLAKITLRKSDPVSYTHLTLPTKA